MGQVAGLAACPGHALGAVVQHRIEVVDQRLHLAREAPDQPRGLAGVHRRQRALQAAQRRQANGHLGDGRGAEQPQQDGERASQRAVEAGDRLLGLGQVGRHHQAPDGPAVRWGRIGGGGGGWLGRAVAHAAFGQQQPGAARAGHLVQVDRAVGNGIRGGLQLAVPERAGAQYTALAAKAVLAARCTLGADAVDLPVQPAIGARPAWVTQAGGVQPRLAGGVDIEPGGDLVELGRQRRAELAQHVVAKQPGQQAACQQQGDQQCHQRGGQQPPAQRMAQRAAPAWQLHAPPWSR